MDWFLGALKKYAVFEGRARRREYWFFALFVVLISVVLTIIDSMIGTMTSQGAGILSGLFCLAVLIPSLAVGARRLHDTGRSGWWQLLSITLIGIIPLILFWAQEGSTEANKYGTVPAPAAA